MGGHWRLLCRCMSLNPELSPRYGAKIMNRMTKTNDTSSRAAATSLRELAEDELALVSGGSKSKGQSQPVEYIKFTMEQVLISS